MRAALPALPALLLAAWSAPGALAAVEKDEARAPAVCVRVDQVHGWNVDGNGDVILRAGANREYRVRIATTTAALGSAAKIALVPNSSGDLCPISGRLVADGRRVSIRSIERIDGSAARG